MKEPRELVLEQALRQVLGSPVDDLSWRVVSAWRQAGAASARRRGTRLRAWPWLLGAVGSAALALMAQQMLSSGRAVVRLDPPALSSAPGQWEPRTTNRVTSGHTVAAEQPAALEWPRGTRAELAAGAVARIFGAEATPRVVLLRGAVTVACARTSPCVVEVGRTSVTAAPGARLRVRALDDDYQLGPRTFSNLTEDLHMHRLTPAATAAITLLSGTAVLHDATGSSDLSVGHTVTRPQDPADKWRAVLAKQEGTWDLTITDYNGDRSREYPGSEVCRFPSGGRWLISDMQADRADGSATWAHTVLGFLTRDGQWTGTFVDNFGGPIGLLSGPIGEDPSVQQLTMRRAGGGDFGIRTTMRWVGDDERRTEIETEANGEWQRVRVIVHRRRE